MEHVNSARLLTTVTTICLVWLAGCSAWIYPHSISYMNELAGGTKNWPKCLLGSNIDWGQDLYELKDWGLDVPVRFQQSQRAVG